MSGVWKVGVVTETHTETASARSILIDIPDWPGNIAGQHVDVRLTAPDGYTAVRSYSLASAGSATQVQLAVDKLPDGEVSPYLVDELRAGDELELRGPLGGWFVWRDTDTAPVQLIGGGSGVVPLIAMIRAHAASASPVEFRLLYSVRTPVDVFYANELKALESDKLTITYVYTRRTPPDWPTAAGRINREIIEQATFPPGVTPAVFVCGPTGFVESVADTLVALGHPAASVKTERFGGK